MPGDSTRSHLASIGAETGFLSIGPSLEATLSVVTVGNLTGMRSAGTTGDWDYRTVDPVTGTFSVLSTFRDISVQQGLTATDGSGSVVYQVVGDVDAPSRLLALDASTGAAIHNQAIDPTLSSIEVASDGRIVGVTIQSSSVAFRSIDPMTGATSVIASHSNDGFGVIQGASAIDRRAGLVYQVISTGAGRLLMALHLATRRLIGVPFPFDIVTIEVCTGCAKDGG